MFNEEVTTVDGLSENVTEWYGYTFPAFEIVTSDNVDYYRPLSGCHSVPQLTTYAAYGDESQAMRVFLDTEVSRIIHSIPTAASLMKTIKTTRITTGGLLRQARGPTVPDSSADAPVHDSRYL